MKAQKRVSEGPSIGEIYSKFRSLAEAFVIVEKHYAKVGRDFKPFAKKGDLDLPSVIKLLNGTVEDAEYCFRSLNRSFEQIQEYLSVLKFKK